MEHAGRKEKRLRLGFIILYYNSRYGDAIQCILFILLYIIIYIVGRQNQYEQCVLRSTYRRNLPTNDNVISYVYNIVHRTPRLRV